VQVLDRVGELPEDSSDQVEIERSVRRDEVLQVVALAQLEDEVPAAHPRRVALGALGLLWLRLHDEDLDEGHNVGMIGSGHRLHLAPHALALGRGRAVVAHVVHELDRQLGAGRQVRRAVDRSKPAASERLFEGEGLLPCIVRDLMHGRPPAVLLAARGEPELDGRDCTHQRSLFRQWCTCHS
jgi:hypothetical protein